MSDVEHTAATTAVPGIPEPLQQMPSNVMQISDKMILLTWLAFGITAFLLHKLLWKPILRAVEGRERSISEALEGAERARRELAEVETRRRESVARASAEAREVTARAAREAADTLARAEDETRAMAQRRIEEAQRSIAAEQRRAIEAVRSSAAEQLCDTLEQFLRNELTEEQRRAYQQTVVGEVTA
ncbi:MAG TPA: ATP synthase F0 subunit B [Kiritimatiellia bacterium]|jgi:F-type H+-transporting ATPase subunit b|nr:ATP synthase F0 subunit B [Kiritimatiellia bacterium]